jgi:phenylalanyl-tRNA synthetase alpha chain
MQEDITALRDKALAAVNQAGDAAALEELRVRLLGRKGELTALLRKTGGLPPEQRPAFGQAVNRLKQEVDQALKDALAALQKDRPREGGVEAEDVTLPGVRPRRGRLHPITQAERLILEVFTRLGFQVVESPEVELDWYCFEALNLPPDHPARDMQDTFFVSDDIVLRTHTSPLQVRVMEKQSPPVRVIAPGKVFRCDSDLTHTPMFHQVEGLMVDEHVSFGDLKGILTVFVHQMFDEQTSLRFRPSFFPFTEPSAEVDILCVMCRGKGCRVCSHTGWLEVLGSGMVHPAVLENVGYDTRRYTGFAFGMGVERIAMLKYGIDDIRKFFENDIRFLTQFE